jgi:phosphotransferase system  glucose/maltose/N-acetylglucosamine-specific IIC component
MTFKDGAMLLNILSIIGVILTVAVGITFLIVPPLGVLVGMILFPTFTWLISTVEKYTK